MFFNSLRDERHGLSRDTTLLNVRPSGMHPFASRPEAARQRIRLPRDRSPRRARLEASKRALVGGIERIRVVGQRVHRPGEIHHVAAGLHFPEEIAPARLGGGP